MKRKSDEPGPNPGASSKLEVLVIEPYVAGHRGPYLCWMVEGMAKSGFSVTVLTTGESMRDTSIRRLHELEMSGSSVTIAEAQARIPSRKRLFAELFTALRVFSYWFTFRAWFRQALKRRAFDVVFIPSADRFLYAFAILGSPFGVTPWVGLVMRPSFHYQSVGILAPRPAFAHFKEKLLLRLIRSKKLQSLLTLDESLYEYLAKKHSIGEKVKFMPAPVDFRDTVDQAQGRRLLGLNEERRFVLLFGGITRRKGVFELLNILCDDSFPANVTVILAGRMAADVRAVFSRHAVANAQQEGRLLVFDRFLSVEEEKLFYAATNIVWAGYRGHYTASEVVNSAASAGKPVIACREGLIGWQTKKHRLGEIVDPSDIHDTIDAIKRLLEAEPHVSKSLSAVSQEIVSPLRAAQHVVCSSLSRSNVRTIAT